jgi:hypothetical protein
MTETAESAPSPAPQPRITGRFDWRALKADLRGAVPDASLALIATGAIFLWLYVRVENGTSATTQVMPMMADNQYWMYWLCQAFGWSGLLWAYITIVFGLLRSGPRPAWAWLPASRLEKWHRTTSLTTIGLMFMHAFMLFAEFVRTDHGDTSTWTGRVATAFAESFVPGWYDSGTGRVAILLGLLAFYLAIPLGLAYYLRQTTGSRLWRALHRFIIVVYVLSVWHTLLYGTNVWYDGTFRTLVWALQVPLAALLLWRLLTPARPRERLRLRGPGRATGQLPLALRLAGRLAVAATIAGLLAVIVTGVDGGRSPDGASAEPWPEPWVLWAGLLVLILVLVAVVQRLLPARIGVPRATQRDEDRR